MDEFEVELAQAGNALRALADGPAREAASAIEQSFETAAARISEAMSGAARSGRLDFEDMADAILRDLTRIAASNVFGTGQSAPSQTINVTMASGGGDARSLFSSQNAIAAAITRAGAAGGRFL